MDSISYKVHVYVCRPTQSEGIKITAKMQRVVKMYIFIRPTTENNTLSLIFRFYKYPTEMEHATYILKSSFFLYIHSPPLQNYIPSYLQNNVLGQMPVGEAILFNHNTTQNTRWVTLDLVLDGHSASAKETGHIPSPKFGIKIPDPARNQTWDLLDGSQAC